MPAFAIAAPTHPHQLVIDLGGEQTITGVRRLPRQNSDHGRIGTFRLYASREAFRGL